MRILDIITAPWAIVPAKLREIEAIYQAHMRGPKVDWKGIRDKIEVGQAEFSQKKAEQGPSLYQIMDGVAVIDVAGVLTKQTTPCSWLFGGTSMQEVGAALREAMADEAVNSVLLFIDSPGGTVDGTQDLTDLVHSYRGQKKIVAYTDGVMASGAYWVGSAAAEIYISGDTVQVGSIGVVATHVDQSRLDEMAGEKYTEITAGKYKGMASSHMALSPDGRQYIQDQVDHLYAVFIESVARNRGISTEKALAMADGKIFLGKQTIDVGLVDGVSTFDRVVKKMAAGVAANNGHYSVKEEPLVNIEELKTKHPDVYAAALAEGKIAGAAEGVTIGKAEGIEAGKALGAAAERQRIADVRSQLIPGHEALIEQLANDGKTMGPEAAMRIVTAEKAVAAGRLAAFTADGSLGVKQPPAPEITGADTAQLSVEDQAKKDYAEKKEIRDEFGTESSYVAYQKAVAEGKVKILGKK